MTRSEVGVSNGFPFWIIEGTRKGLGSAQSRPGGAGALTRDEVSDLFFFLFFFLNRYPIIDRIGWRPRLDEGVGLERT